MDKRVTFASTNRMEYFEREAERFMGEMFGFEPGSYLVTDESRLSDFFPCGLDDASVDAAESLEATYEAWDRWALEELERRYGVKPEATTILLTDLLWSIAQTGKGRTTH